MWLIFTNLVFGLVTRSVKVRLYLRVESNTRIIVNKFMLKANFISAK